MVILIKIAVLTVLTSIAAPWTGYADDFNLPVSAPILRISTPLETKSIKVNITEDKIIISHHIINMTEHQLSYEMTFTTPSYRWFGMSENNQDRSYSDLIVKVNGQNVTYRKIIEAFLNNINVTNKLAKYNINPNIISDSKQFPTDTQENRTNFHELIENKLFTPNHLTPEWSAKNTYTWLQHFPPKIELIFEYQYEPLFGSMIIGNNSSDTFFKIGHGFTWETVERYYGKHQIDNLSDMAQQNSIGIVGGNPNVKGVQSDYIIKWLAFQLDNIISDIPISRVTVTAEAVTDKDKKSLIFLNYGDAHTANLSHAELSYENITGTDTISVLFLTPLR